MGSIRISNLVTFLAVLVLPAMTFAATQQGCQSGPPTAQSSTWNFSQEAAGLLHQINTDAYQAKSAAARLESFSFERGVIDWQADADQLRREKHWVNDMDQRLCRLRTIERVLPASQQAEINKIKPAVIEATDTTQSAVKFLDHHQDQLFMQQYKSCAPALYNEDNRIQAATAHPSQYTATNAKASS